MRCAESLNAVHVLVAADHNFTRPLAVTLASALRSSAGSCPLSINVIDGGIKPRAKARLGEVVRAHGGAELRWHSATSFDLNGLEAGQRGITRASYLRLFASRIFSNEVTRVIYLDSDLLVRTDLRQLLDSDLDGKTIGAVRDMVISSLSHHFCGVRLYRPELHPWAPYFNAGVLVFDLSRWRRMGYESRTLHYARSHGDAGNHDQDALNAELVDDWHPLDLRWNLQGSLLLTHEHPADEWARSLEHERNQLLVNPHIVHFSGSLKPWQSQSAHPYRREWIDTLRNSGWYGDVAGALVCSGITSAQRAYHVVRRARQVGTRERLS